LRKRRTVKAVFEFRGVYLNSDEEKNRKSGSSSSEEFI